MYTYNRSAIKPNPLLETYRVMLLAMGIVMAFVLVGTVVAVIAILSGGQAIHAVNMFIIDFPMFILALVGFSLQYRYWKRIERRRLVAAEGDCTLIAEEQPMPDAAALRLPESFKMSMRKVQIALFAIFLEIVIIFFSVYGWFIMSDISFWLFPVGGTVLVLIFMLLIVMTSGQVLEVTEVGLENNN